MKPIINHFKTIIEAEDSDIKQGQAKVVFHVSLVCGGVTHAHNTANVLKKHLEQGIESMGQDAALKDDDQFRT